MPLSVVVLTHRYGGEGKEVGERPRLQVGRVLLGRVQYALVGRVHHDPVHREQQLRLCAAQVEAGLLSAKKRECRLARVRACGLFDGGPSFGLCFRVRI